MSTIEDFKNAPVGATATHADGSRAMKIDDGEQRWITSSGNQYNDEGMVFWEYTLEPSTPTTAREALELAWELAHPVKEGQIVPEGARYLTSSGSGLKESTSCVDQKMSPHLASINRTLDPLPDPEPDWLDAHAVIASKCWCHQGVWLPVIDGHWKCARCGKDRHWTDLEDVTPLYPEGQDA